MSVWVYVMLSVSTMKESIDLPVASRHCLDITEKLLKMMINLNEPPLEKVRSDTNWAVQQQKMVRGLKFWIQEVFFLFSLTSLSRLFHSYRDEPIGRWGETGVPRENHLTHPQADLGLSHMWPVGGSNLHQTQW